MFCIFIDSKQQVHVISTSSTIVVIFLELKEFSENHLQHIKVENNSSYFRTSLISYKLQWETQWTSDTQTGYLKYRAGILTFGFHIVIGACDVQNVQISSSKSYGSDLRTMWYFYFSRSLSRFRINFQNLESILRISFTK